MFRRKRKRKDPQAKLRDAVMSADARERAAAASGKKKDNARAVLAVGRVAWRLRKAQKKRR